eukprot:CAMPEP_0119358238 /NCGR_PEP_ID=MMETSP1334-20130426/6488_1 /TAXON_ID=127549 /ORGANISM="Calcidiscus leptoporus, Strain RCC1130" /LENGTH=78 /DNA_ID=CAMNT_0007372681 /DNA_START=214 /DNA_END=447 /DNA_ORIENTATION=+
MRRVSHTLGSQPPPSLTKTTQDAEPQTPTVSDETQDAEPQIGNAAHPHRGWFSSPPEAFLSHSDRLNATIAAAAAAPP